MSKAKEQLFKLVIIGDASTGKSSLLRRYCDNEFIDKYTCTIGVDFQIKILKMPDQSIVKLQIWDTAGQERFKVMTKSYYRSAKGCLIVYDITRRETFENVKAWAEQFAQSNSQQSKQSVLILGNKKDLEDKRQVQLEEGEQLAKEIGCHFHEVSAKEGGEEISQIFYALAEQLYKTVLNPEVKAADPVVEKPSHVLKEFKKDKKKKSDCCK
jgi:small GTP-binding protein